MNLEEYQISTAATRDARMAWWREAKFGMFIHYGIYSCYGRGEWVKMREGISEEEYNDTLNTRMTYKPGTAEEWIKCAKAAGMKYAILTTQHHDGFSLWDSKDNPYNSVNLGPQCDIVGDFVAACRKYGIRVGLYFSLVNWTHPDGQICRTDEAARERFLASVDARLRELMTQYGKIDILWYDVPSPMRTAEEWKSMERNAMVRELQPEIIINNRCYLPEDFAVEEDQLKKIHDPGDFEGCMRFSLTAFGGVDHEKAIPYSMTAASIVKTMSLCQYAGGNLVFNISPNGDGSIDTYERETLEQVGKWIEKHSEAVYGASDRAPCGANGISTAVRKGNRVFLWNWIWSPIQRINGYKKAPLSVRCVTTGEYVKFRYERGVLELLDLPEKCPDDILNFTIFELDFEGEVPDYSLIPQNMMQFMNI